MSVSRVSGFVAIGGWLIVIVSTVRNAATPDEALRLVAISTVTLLVVLGLALWLAWVLGRQAQQRLRILLERRPRAVAWSSLGSSELDRFIRTRQADLSLGRGGIAVGVDVDGLHIVAGHPKNPRRVTLNADQLVSARAAGTEVALEVIEQGVGRVDLPFAALGAGLWGGNRLRARELKELCARIDAVLSQSGQ